MFHFSATAKGWLKGCMNTLKIIRHQKNGSGMGNILSMLNNLKSNNQIIKDHIRFEMLSNQYITYCNKWLGYIWIEPLPWIVESLTYRLRPGKKPGPKNLLNLKLRMTEVIPAELQVLLHQHQNWPNLYLNKCILFPEIVTGLY